MRSASWTSRLAGTRRQRRAGRSSSISTSGARTPSTRGISWILGAPHVVGRYLWDKPRKVLYRLARSKSPSERRTAIVSTLYFVRKGDVEDTFELAKLLLDDDDPYVQKATGGLLREAGKKDVGRLRSFLGDHAGTMAPTTLRYAMEHLTPAERERYRRKRVTR